jgi:hypothetical protein
MPCSNNRVRDQVGRTQRLVDPTARPHGRNDPFRRLAASTARSSVWPELPRSGHRRDGTATAQSGRFEPADRDPANGRNRRILPVPGVLANVPSPNPQQLFAAGNGTGVPRPALIDLPPGKPPEGKLDGSEGNGGGSGSRLGSRSARSCGRSLGRRRWIGWLH